MIGIFDSGVGGLTVVKEIFKYLSEYQIIYFGDIARLPYGTKGEKFVKKYSAKITDWLIKKGAKIIIVACNTSSAWAADSLKKEFSAHGGSASGGKNVPIFEMITPAIKEAKRVSKNRKIGIIGTPGTIRSGVYEKKLSRLNNGFRIFSKDCPLFVPLVEEGWVEGGVTEEIAREYLKPIKQKNIDALILGCTHYPLLKNVIVKIMGGKVKIVNPAESLIKEVKLFLKNNPKIESQLKKGNKHQFFFSDTPYNFQKISHLCFKRKIKIKVQDPF